MESCASILISSDFSALGPPDPKLEDNDTDEPSLSYPISRVMITGYKLETLGCC